MSAELGKDSIDLGIVVTDLDASLAFYRDTLGFIDAGEVPIPGGSMRRLMCGTSTIKLLSPGRTPPAVAPPGGMTRSSPPTCAASSLPMASSWTAWA